MKNIIVGDITETYVGTPIYIFKIAMELSEQDNFTVKTNNPQFVEALEVLCGEDNIHVYLNLYGECVEVSFLIAYNYLGDIYDITDAIRLGHILFDGRTHDEFLQKSIVEYNKRYYNIIKK